MPLPLLLPIAYPIPRSEDTKHRNHDEVLAGMDNLLSQRLSPLLRFIPTLHYIRVSMAK